MVNFYHRLIPNCAKLQQPLTKLLSGHSKKLLKLASLEKAAFEHY